MQSAVAGMGQSEVDYCLVATTLIDSKNPLNLITQAHINGLTLMRVRDEEETTVEI